MNRFFHSFCLPLLLLLPLLVTSGCAEKTVWVSTDGMLSLERDEIRELHEAFKTNTEKTIVLEKQKQEVECDGSACPVTVEASAKYRRKDSSTIDKKVEAKLVFGREDAKKILELLEKARYEQKELQLSGKHGAVRCEQSRCRITFSLARELRGYLNETLP